MKNFFIIILVLGFTAGMITSCGKKDEPKEDAKTEQASQPADDQAKTDNAAGATDVDKWLDEYEKFLDEYIPLAKKAMAGDAAAAQELQKFTARATEFANQAQNMGTKFTTEQAERALKLAEKAMNVMK